MRSIARASARRKQSKLVFPAKLALATARPLLLPRYGALIFDTDGLAIQTESLPLSRRTSEMKRLFALAVLSGILLFLVGCGVEGVTDVTPTAPPQPTEVFTPIVLEAT